MPKCPNCGQRTEDNFCQWCGYPIRRGGSARNAKAKKEAEQASKKGAKMEAREARKAEVKARKEAERAAKERARREAEEAKRAKEAKDRVKGEEEDEEAVSAELYQGIVKLTIVPPIDLGQVRKLEEYLSQVQDLRLVLIGGSVDEGTEIAISAENPIPLMDVLREIPPVEQVVKKGRKIQITLKAE